MLSFGRAVPAAAPFFDVHHPDAVGDGTRNDRPAVQSAENAAVQASGGVVTFRTGRYRCHRPILKRRAAWMGAAVLNTGSVQTASGFSQRQRHRGVG